MPDLEVTGLCSHFAAVEPKANDTAQAQFKRFEAASRQLPRDVFRHISSSRAMLFHKEWDLDGVRPGIVLYGYGSSESGMRVRSQPVLQWKTSVVQVKAVPAGSKVGYYGTHTTQAPTRLATLAVGYADGYLRTLSNRGQVLIRGRRRKVVGRVSMNWLTVDVGDDQAVREGDEAVLLGEQGGEAIWADELARQCRTIAYEILTGINAAIERTYTG
jgi:alanine racemase